MFTKEISKFRFFAGPYKGKEIDDEEIPLSYLKYVADNVDLPYRILEQINLEIQKQTFVLNGIRKVKNN